MIQDIEYAGIRGSSLKVFVRERPEIPAAKVRRTKIEIPGRDGAIYQSDEEFEETEISVSMNYIGSEIEWEGRWRRVQKWLAETNSILRFSDDTGYFFRISYVELGSNERPSARTGVFQATFVTRDGLHYLDSGLLEYSPGRVRRNPYERSKPVYKISGEGRCVLTVNGKEMEVNVGQNIAIDTERMVAYREDGTLLNTSVSGNYEDLFLQKGNNEISCTEGFDLKVIPNWRCR